MLGHPAAAARLSPLVRPGPRKVGVHTIDFETLSSVLGLAFQTTTSAPELQIRVPMTRASDWVFFGIRSAYSKSPPAARSIADSAAA